MAIPDFQSLMLPVLKHAGHVKDEIPASRATEDISAEIGLTEEDLNEKLPSGLQSIFSNRLGWAITYLKKAGLLESTKRGYYKITALGEELLSKNPNSLRIKDLKNYSGFIEFREGKTADSENEESNSDYDPTQSPHESLEKAYNVIRKNVANELLGKLKKIKPQIFENLVVKLIVKMGYGGFVTGAGKVVGKSGDGGIDGIIKEDKLGLDMIYIQAKRWENVPVGRPDIMQFAGALQGQRANKGIFITTSRFTDEAIKYVSTIGSKIVLIDGEKLTELMIDHDVGVSVETQYITKRVDNDYFDELM